MDFAVNQRANGLFLYRSQDTMWLWDAEVEKILDGWNDSEMQKFAKLVGIKFDEGKTGAACVGPTCDGFLKFDVKEAKFVIDQEQVDFHIAELRRRLQSTKWVFGCVNVYNEYMAYLFENLGGIPANCFGETHTQAMIATFTRIQRTVPHTKLGALEHLRKVLAERFGVQDIPDGYFYFPLASGGLGLQNVMLRTGQFANTRYAPRRLMRRANSPLCGIHATPPSHLRPVGDEFLARIANDEMEYQQSKRLWEEWYTAVKGRGEFMSFEEYNGLRECGLPNWGDLYMEMLQVPRPMEIVPLLAVGGQPSPAVLDDKW
ncbi:hypothetical protein M413DRAFT_10795 [Hebeloma cylindrosporum]|uniref:Uncharacterized protein n=1 Tax=Hebeloma cylindrosporum TaxID=76867 RepID=A0A0C2XWB5_HEBCY|nr:hypothetical protein M413DRAFT_10795 [Hebeloma cylindrosporum h7]